MIDKFVAFSAYCDPPPAIENAEVALSRTSEIGEMVLYACVDGFIKVGGDSRLTCTLSKDNTATWAGAQIECTNRNSGALLPSRLHKFENCLQLFVVCTNLIAFIQGSTQFLKKLITYKAAI